MAIIVSNDFCTVLHFDEVTKLKKYTDCALCHTKDGARVYLVGGFYDNNSKTVHDVRIKKKIDERDSHGNDGDENDSDENDNLISTSESYEDGNYDDQGKSRRIV